MDPKERLQLQKKMLQKRLGLGMAGALGMETSDLFSDEDLIVRKNSTEQKLVTRPIVSIIPGVYYVIKR